MSATTPMDLGTQTGTFNLDSTTPGRLLDSFCLLLADCARRLGCATGDPISYGIERRDDGPYLHVRRTGQAKPFVAVGAFEGHVLTMAINLHNALVQSTPLMRPTPTDATIH